MSLGKASIKRASAAGKKKTTESKVVENAAVLTPMDAEEVQTKFIVQEVKAENPNRPVRLKDEMPTFLL